MQDPAQRTRQAWDLLGAGKISQAESAARAILQKFPNFAEANNLMAVICSSTGKVAPAMYYAKQATRLAPNDRQYWMNLGNFLCAGGEISEGAAAMTRAAEIAPDWSLALTTLSTTLIYARRFAEARARAREACRIDPENPKCTAALALALLQTGESEEALAIVRTAIAAGHQGPDLLPARAIVANYPPNTPPEELLEAGRACAAWLKAETPPLEPSGAPRADARSLRLGLISPDFRNHSVARFMHPLLEHLDHALLEPHLYYYGTSTDDDTARFRAASKSFTTVRAMPARRIAEIIRRDRIDVLIELAGYTEPQGLAVLAMRPSALQGAYCGYPGTTGLDAVDFRIVDSLTDPPGADRLASERLVRLDPCFLCYEAPRHAPDITPTPATRNGFITFGSFNSLLKMNSGLVSLWSRLLRAVPHSRLLLKNESFKDEQIRTEWAARFANAGVDARAIDLVSWIDDAGGHLGAYSRVDIALDTFPYHGTTTTCEALYMGVPVVTLAGDRHASRVGVSLLTNAGFPQLIAGKDEEYIAAASTLASEPERLGAVRAGLRHTMMTSPIMDGRAFAERFTRALLSEWDRRAGS